MIKSGLNDKSVTVRVDYQYYVKKYKMYNYGISRFLCHDEENFCVSGDKVVIRACEPISSRKHYFVRNVIKPFPRDDFYENKETNPMVEQEYKKLFTSFIEKEVQRSPFKNKKDEHKIKTQIKAKAMAKAIQNLKKLETEKKKDQHQASRAAESSRPQENKGTAQPSE